jgi:hypothetical protein
MEPNNTDNTESLGLEPEVNPLMAQQSERTDLADDEKLTQFFGRALADGQQEAEPQAVEPEETVDEAVSDEAEVATENTEEESQEQESEEQPQATPKGVDKRISKLTAQRKEAEERAKKLEEELESFKRRQATPQNANNPFGKLDSEDKIEAEYERQKEIRLFCERYPDGYYEDGKEPIDKEQIAKAKVNAIRAMDDFLPKQMDYVEKSKQFKAAARKEFPWLNDPSDKRAIMAKRFIEAVPEVTKFPDYEIYAAHLANGMVSYQQQKQASRTGNPVQQKVPVQPTYSSLPPSQAKKPDAVKAKQAETRYRQTSSLDDLTDVFKNKFI